MGTHFSGLGRWLTLKCPTYTNGPRSKENQWSTFPVTIKPKPKASSRGSL